MSWLLDTCVISEPARRTPDPKVMQWLANQTEEDLFISVLTLVTRHTDDMPETGATVFNPWEV